MRPAIRLLKLAVLVLGLLFISSCMQTASISRTGPAVIPVMTAATASAPLAMPVSSHPEPAPALQPTAAGALSQRSDPEGCQKPPDDYARVAVNGWILDQRTYAMLKHAAQLYGGEIEITGSAITQGSYHDNGAASFGTHLGGGAVDLSVMRKGTFTILHDQIEPLIHALRVAGFAAWLRDFNELYPGSPIHIHAIAIGDRELSDPARKQLVGPFGYFRGFTGVPIPSGVPAPDRHDDPILCQWMRDLGYTDLSQPPKISRLK
jgi:hypothetical protein